MKVEHFDTCGLTTENDATAHAVLRTLAAILDHGLKTNSYKCALALALSELPASVDDNSPLVSAHWLAGRFLHYYWPLATRFRIRQSIDPAKAPIAMTASRDLATKLKLKPGTPLHKVRDRHSAEYEALVHRLASSGGCLDDVLRRFHHVRGKTAKTRLFEECGRDIALLPGIAAVLEENREVIRQCVLGAWVRFTEEKSASPKLYAKLSGSSPNRKGMKAYHEALEAAFGKECFYCGEKEAKLHVDHFLPWSFVLEDKLWNLVLACGEKTKCNLDKSDRIPKSHLVARLIERNAGMLRGDFGTPLQEHKDLKEWKYDAADLTKHIEQLVVTALAETFSPWDSGPS